LGIAGSSFPWLGHLANNAGHYLSLHLEERDQPKRYEADTKEMKEDGYRKDGMDAD
jgi:hypothetical protein